MDVACDLSMILKAQSLERFDLEKNGANFKNMLKFCKACKLEDFQSLCNEDNVKIYNENWNSIPEQEEDGLNW